jgi:hypothetical protein
MTSFDHVAAPPVFSNAATNARFPHDSFKAFQSVANSLKLFKADAATAWSFLNSLLLGPTFSKPVDVGRATKFYACGDLGRPVDSPLF